MFKKFVLLAAAAFTALSLLPQPVSAQDKKDSVVMGMTLEPPGLDPTAGAAAAIGEVTLYNVYETLTKVKEDGSVGPLLAEGWEIAPDLKTYTFKLRKGVKFQNGEPFNAEAVKFSYERAAAATSTNKDKSLFLTMAQIRSPDSVVVDHADQMAGIPQCGSDQAQQDRHPHDQRSVRAGGIAAFRRRRCLPPGRRRAQPGAIQG
jgi:peptide/nickel transport system substrate-binding protein